MQVYIAASWRHQHSVEMLTKLIREQGHIVVSFVEDGLKREWSTMPFEKWMQTKSAMEAFEHDSQGAIQSDITVYIGPSGKDAMAECGMAYAAGKFLIALYAKGEDLGITRKMFGDRWCGRYTEVLDLIKSYSDILNS